MKDEMTRQYRVQMLQRRLNDLYREHDRNPDDYKVNLEIRDLKSELRRLDNLW